EIYYEVTFYPAQNKINQFDRIIGFTQIDIVDKYASELKLQKTSITVLGQEMPMIVIRNWHVSIRHCEFDNFAQVLGLTTQTKTYSKEYKFLMDALTRGSSNILELIDSDDTQYRRIREQAVDPKIAPQIFLALDKAREIIKGNLPG